LPQDSVPHPNGPGTRGQCALREKRNPIPSRRVLKRCIPSKKECVGNALKEASRRGFGGVNYQRLNTHWPGQPVENSIYLVSIS